MQPPEEEAWPRVSPTHRGRAGSARRSRASRTSWSRSGRERGTSSVTGGRNGLPPPMTTGLRNMRSSSTRPSSIAAAARPAPPVETSLSVASSAAAISSASDASASRALPWTLSSVRLKTTFGIAPDVGEGGPELVVAHRRVRLPRQHRLVKPAAAQMAAELACLRDVETKLLLVGGRPPERALAVGDEAVHGDAHRVDQHGFRSSHWSNGR
jgi:hypothetical protein